MSPEFFKFSIRMELISKIEAKKYFSDKKVGDFLYFGTVFAHTHTHTTVGGDYSVEVSNAAGRVIYRSCPSLAVASKSAAIAVKAYPNPYGR